MDESVPYMSSEHLMSEPIEQVNERKKERARVLSEAPLIKDVINHLDERIAFYKSIDSIRVDLAADPLGHQKAVMVNQMVVENLTQEKGALEALVQEYLKK